MNESTIAINNPSKSVTAIKELLKSVNIQKIIYVDDKFDIEYQKEKIIAGLIEQKNKRQKIEGLDINWRLPESTFSQHLQEVWLQWTPQQKEACFQKISTQNNDIDVIPIGILEKNFSDQLIKLTPSQWESTGYSYFEKSEVNEKFLCLFDVEFNGESERNGIDFARKLLDSKHKEKVYCGIFSQRFSPEEEQEQCEKIKREQKFRDFYPISKKRLSDEEGLAGFTEGIKNVLLVRHIEKLKDESQEILEHSLSNVKERIQKVTPATFNRIVQKTSYEEGIWEVDSLFRLINILLDQATKKAIISEEKRRRFNASVREIRSVEKVETEKPDDFPNLQLKQLQEEEIFYQADIINALHLPLANGDIFQVNNKEYILLCQPCNLALRKEGKRGNNLNHAFLVELKNETVDFFKGKTKQQQSVHEEIKGTKSNGQMKIACFSKYKSVSLTLLDLVVYNTEGKATISFKSDLEFPEIMHVPCCLRYKNIKKDLRKYRDVTLAIKRNKQHITAEDWKLLYDYIYAPQCIKELGIEGSKIYNSATDEFVFPIRRILHYKSIYSLDLLHKFMQYLSRNGFDREFTEEDVK